MYIRNGSKVSLKFLKSLYVNFLENAKIKIIPYVFFLWFLNLFLNSFAGSQELIIPENPLKGRLVFERKGCINCHSIKGDGGNIGTDLGQKKFYGSFLEFASIMWNHSPEMLWRMRELDLPYPKFTSNEMVELVAYLYYLRYLGEPGDLYRGKFLVKEKGCLVCHSIAGKGEKIAPAFDELSKYISPLYLVQVLWNHGPEMDNELKNRGLTRPKFEKREIVDLSAYIREASEGMVHEQVYISPGNPKKGNTVFKNKGCLECHALSGEGDNIGPDLRKLKMDHSVTEIAGLMWNHGSKMSEYMVGQNLSWPNFTGKEMADLIAYLYFLRFEDEVGSVEAGKKIFMEKDCYKCHGTEGRGGEMAPDLSKSAAISSSLDIARIMWNHAPVMEERILEKIIQWPELSGKEMRDLYTFLHSLQLKSKENNQTDF